MLYKPRTLWLIMTNNNLTGWLWELNELIHNQCLAQYRTHCMLYKSIGWYYYCNYSLHLHLSSWPSLPLPPITCWCSLVLCQVLLISFNSFREWLGFSSSGNSANSEPEIKCKEPPVENLRHLRAACSPAADTHSPRWRDLHGWERSRPLSQSCWALGSVN